MKAKEIMTPDPVTVTPSDTIARAAELMQSYGIGMVPVIDGAAKQRVEGVITDRDITVRCVAEHHGTDCHVADHMTSAKLATVRPDDDISAVMDKMEREQVRRVLVVDERGMLAGVIAQADLATKLGPKEPARVEHVLERISAPRGIPVA
ncbi:MAG: CBS domain-containing protein [Gemmatimonadaceae bacterium]|nr:CBS domain-containing protein [Gemmatimonadaceae bacterium]